MLIYTETEKDIMKDNTKDDKLSSIYNIMKDNKWIYNIRQRFTPFIFENFYFKDDEWKQMAFLKWLRYCIVFDTETTGLNILWRDLPFQIHFKKIEFIDWKARTVDTLHIELSIPDNIIYNKEEIEKITHINIDERKDIFENNMDAINQINSFLRDSKYSQFMFAHNWEFDTIMMNNLYNYYWIENTYWYKVYDTIQLMDVFINKRAWKFYPEKNLDFVINHIFKHKVDEVARHSAEYDTLNTVKLLAFMKFTVYRKIVEEKLRYKMKFEWEEAEFLEKMEKKLRWLVFTIKQSPEAYEEKRDNILEEINKVIEIWINLNNIFIEKNKWWYTKTEEMIMLRNTLEYYYIKHKEEIDSKWIFFFNKSDNWFFKLKDRYQVPFTQNKFTYFYKWKELEISQYELNTNFNKREKEITNMATFTKFANRFIELEREIKLLKLKWQYINGILRDFYKLDTNKQYPANKNIKTILWQLWSVENPIYEFKMQYLPVNQTTSRLVNLNNSVLLKDIEWKNISKYDDLFEKVENNWRFTIFKK